MVVICREICICGNLKVDGEEECDAGTGMLVVIIMRDGVEITVT